MKTKEDIFENNTRKLSKTKTNVQKVVKTITCSIAHKECSVQCSMLSQVSVHVTWHILHPSNVRNTVYVMQTVLSTCTWRGVTVYVYCASQRQSISVHFLIKKLFLESVCVVSKSAKFQKCKLPLTTEEKIENLWHALFKSIGTFFKQQIISIKRWICVTLACPIRC